MYIDKYGNTISRERYIELQLDREYKTINRTIVGGYLVSTIWCCVSLTEMFETMLFLNNGEYADIVARRYDNMNDASIGHIALVYETACTRVLSPDSSG